MSKKSRKEMKHRDLVGMPIVGNHGREVGVIQEAHVDLKTWKVVSLDVELNPDAIEDLKLKQPWFGSQVVRMETSQVAGVSDVLVLKVPLENMKFSGGKSK